MISNLVTNAVLPSKFYCECVSFLSSLRFGDEDLNSKNLYKLLLSKELSLPLLLGHWTPVLGPSFSLSSDWSHVRDEFCENFKENILWPTVSRGNKVRDSHARWGYISNPLCAFRGRRETIDHCFLNCAQVQCVWLHFSPLSSRVLGSQFTPTPPFVYSFAGLLFLPKNLPLGASLLRPLFTGFGISEIRLPFKILRTLTE